MKVFEQLTDLEPLVGTEVTVTDWVTVDQKAIDLFAQATGDHQWIHVDPVRAAQGPFGTPIAHGFLTLSLLPRFLEAGLDIRGVRMGVNYGLNKVRFMAPVPVDSRLRARLSLAAFDRVPDGACQLTWTVSIEREGAERPVCVAESLVRLYA
jgi:acyl dehydratase